MSADPLLVVFSNNTIGKETPPSVDNKIVTFFKLLILYFIQYI